ncbi:hypothetical protein EON65_26830 [archaeon]|nr:MAG: hypothetical protein EON65_26830 [archaeon]
MGGNFTIANITLSTYNLSGTLSDSLVNISSLSTLTLDFNRIGGTFPAAWCSMQSISSLSLRDNFLGGYLPSCVQYNMTTLTLLSLHNNLFHGPLQPFGRLTNLTYLSYSNNYFSGTIPPTLSLLTSLIQLYLQSNHLVGALDPVTYLSNVIDLSLSENMLSMSLPDSLGQMKSIRYLYVQENFLRGNIPSSIGNLSKLIYLTFYKNEMTGQIPSSIGGCHDMMFFSVDHNHLSGPLPHSIANWTELQQIVLYDNLFSGTLLSEFSQMQLLNLILVQQNMFTGDPGYAFNTTVQKSMQIIDIASNPFTGSICENMFGEALVSFSAYDVCFSGGFPVEMCNSKRIKTLVIDGITAGCSQPIWPGIPGSPRFTASVEGGLPECIWTDIQNLTTLHAAGNGLSGTIPTLDSYANLTDLDLSFNSFTGTLPRMLQNWTRLINFDVENNKFVGSITYMGDLRFGYDDHVGDTDSISINLNTNRLSGIIPLEFQYAENMHIVEGNLFTCSITHQPPDHDPNSSGYVCGSNLVDISLYIFAASVLILLLFITLVLYYFRRFFHREYSICSVQWFYSSYNALLDHQKLYDNWRNLEKKCDMDWQAKLGASVLCIMVWSSKLWHSEQSAIFITKYPHLRQFLVSLRTLRSLTVSVSIFMVVVGVPLFYLLKLQYRTYYNQFRWEVSGAFMSGYQPAFAVIVFWMIIITFCLMTIAYYIPVAKKEIIVDFSAKTNDSPPVIDRSSASAVSVVSRAVQGFLGKFPVLCRQLSRKSTWASAGMLMGNMIVVLGIKSAVIYMLVSHDSSFIEKILLELTLGVVDIIWSAVLVPFLINNLPSLSSTGRMMLKVFVLLINSLLTSCLAIIVTDPSCFEGLFVMESSTTENFTYTYCDYYTSDGNCVYYVSYHSTREYTPEFFYNYNCYSAVVTEYIPIYFMSYCMLILFIPLGSWLAVKSSKKRWYIFLFYPEIFWSKNSSPDIFAVDQSRNKVSTMIKDSEQKNDVASPLQALSSQDDQHTTATLSTSSLENQGASEKSFNTLNSMNNDSLQSRLTEKRSRLLFPGFILASGVHHLLIVLTFGIMFPPLALAIAVLAICSTYTWEVLIGRWLLMQDSSEDNALSRLDDVCAYVCCGPRKCLWILAYGSAIFVGMTAMDIAGDKMGWKKAIWTPFSTLFFATVLLLYISTQKGYGAYLFTDMPQAEPTAVKVLEEVTGENPVDYSDYRNREFSRMRFTSLASVVAGMNSSINNMRPNVRAASSIGDVEGGVSLGSIVFHNKSTCEALS